MEMSVAQFARGCDTARRGAAHVLMVIVILALMLVGAARIANPGVTKPQQLVTLGVLTGVAVRSSTGLDTLRGWLDRRFFREAVDTERVLHELTRKCGALFWRSAAPGDGDGTISNALHVPASR